MQNTLQRAFSLVEVALALGICSFVIISLLGLMSVGLDSGKQAAQDTAVAAVAKTVLNDLKTNNYTTLKSGINATRYFSYGGVEVTNPSDAHFECVIRVAAHDSAGLPAWLKNPDRAMRTRITIIAPATSGKTNSILETTIASY